MKTSLNHFDRRPFKKPYGKMQSMSKHIEQRRQKTSVDKFERAKETLLFPSFSFKCRFIKLKFKTWNTHTHSQGL